MKQHGTEVHPQDRHMTTPRPGYFPIMEAAKYASVSTKTIRRWINNGLPTYQGTQRGKVLLRPSDIDDYMTKRQVPQIDLDAMVDEVLQDIQVGSASTSGCLNNSGKRMLRDQT